MDLCDHMVLKTEVGQGIGRAYHLEWSCYFLKARYAGVRPAWHQMA